MYLSRDVPVTLNPLVRPTLHTPRLTLRPFVAGDAPEVARLAGDAEVARQTASLPHPYLPEHAEAWISTHARAWERSEELALAVVLRSTEALVGCVGLRVAREQQAGELGYWVGRASWGRGYATEAAGALVHLGFTGLGLQRVWAQYFRRNGGSGRVMQKLGMRHEGTLRRHFLRDGERLDVEVCGLLAEEWRAR
jgi:RimJ/RimL family protein N-acetyltransferase